MTDNALDPPPARRSKASGRRIALIVVGVVIAIGVIFTVAKVAFFHPQTDGRGGVDRAAFSRGAAGPAPTPPPAVTPEAAEKTKANIAAMHRAASSPALVPGSVQVATVSPPAGRGPSGIGVNRSRKAPEPSDG